MLNFLKGLFLDSSNSPSSKRVFGALGFLVAAGLAIAGLVMGSDVAFSLVYAFLGFAAIALGMGALELERKNK